METITSTLPGPAAHPLDDLGRARLSRLSSLSSLTVLLAMLCYARLLEPSSTFAQRLPVNVVAKFPINI